LEQVENYLDLLNLTTNRWMPGRYLERQSFTVGAYDVRAWWEAPGLIVYQTRINKEKALVTAAMLCYFTYTSTIEELQKRVRELPNYFPPIPERSPAFPSPIIFPPMPIPVFVVP
jgi:hypothetical protein